MHYKRHYSIATPCTQPVRTIVNRPNLYHNNFGEKRVICIQIVSTLDEECENMKIKQNEIL